MKAREQLCAAVRVVAPAVVFIAVQLLLKTIAGHFCADAVGEGTIACALTCALLPGIGCAYGRETGKLQAERQALLWEGGILSAVLAVGAILYLHRGTDGAETIIKVLGWGVIGPINEEIVYRGFVFQRGRKLWPLWPALLLSAVMFAAGHASVRQFAAAFVAGLLFAAVYERSGRLIIPIMLHIGWNLVVSTKLTETFLVFKMF